VSRVGIEPTTT